MAFFLLIFRPRWGSASSLLVASLPKNSDRTTALWVKSCGCFSAGSSARGVVPSLTESAPLELWERLYFPLSPLPHLSLWCAGGNLCLLSHFLFSLFFSQKSLPIRRARTPDKRDAIEGAEFSWPSVLFASRRGFGKTQSTRTQEPISVVRRCL